MTDDNDHSKDDKDSEVSIDFSWTKKIFSSKSVNVLVILLLILIPVALTIYIRLQPQYLPTTDDMAKNAVNNYYMNSISQQVASQYPNLPTAQKQTMVNQQFAQFQQANKAMLDQQIQQTSQYFKSGFEYQENNHTYTFLGDIDSYQWARMARNIEQKGSVCDEIVNGNCIDNHMLAPIGLGGISTNLHIDSIVYLHKILHFFDPSVNLMQAQFLVPTIIAVIAAIAAFFIGRRIMNDAAGFFASILVSVSPLLLTRSLGSDDDIWNIMLPLIIIWLFLEAFESKDKIKRIVYAALAGLFCGIFSYQWTGWWYIFDFITMAIVAYIGFEIVKKYIKHKNFKNLIDTNIINTIIILVVLVVSAGIFVTIFTNFGTFTSSVVTPIALSANLKSAALSNLWPNVYTTVAELNSADIPTIIGQLAFGMNILFSLALLGGIFTMVKKKPDFKEYILIIGAAIIYLILISPNVMTINLYIYMALLLIPVIVAGVMLLREKESEIDVKTAFLLIIWFIGMIYASIKGVRFILLLTPVFGIALGVSLGYIYQYFVRVFSEGMHLSDKLSKIGVFILLCLVILVPVQIGMAAGRSYMPSMTKGWWDSLTKIRDESKPDAIINSWWDFGHWFKYAADRRVSLDGATQNSPVAHWLGEILQSNDENRSIAVLRMLDCGSNSAFDEIDKKFSDTEKSENIVSDIIVKSKADAARELAGDFSQDEMNTLNAGSLTQDQMNTLAAANELIGNGYSQDEINTILNYTHCNPPEDYFITSEDMVGKAGVWAHFGLWSFDKAFIVNNIRGKNLSDAVQIMKDRWNYTSDYATKVYYDAEALQSDSDMNSWISPWPSYTTSTMVPCTNISEMVLCDMNIGIGNNGQQNLVMNRVVVNISDPTLGQARVGVYDATSGAKLGDQIINLKEVVIADTELKKYEAANSSIGLSILIDVTRNGNQTSYSALVADPLLIDSTFTKLFYLDGKYLSHFEKFSDVTDITGQRIIVWKIKW